VFATHEFFSLVDEFYSSSSGAARCAKDLRLQRPARMGAVLQFSGQRGDGIAGAHHQVN
jgi:hypothetical protein